MKRTPTHDRLAFKSFYRRNLPHIQPVNATLFVTFRLIDSLPQSVRQMADQRRDLEAKISDAQIRNPKSASLRAARRQFAILESCLDRAAFGPTWLANARVADMVAEALHFRDGEMYRLDAFSIMPNHVHALFQPFMTGNEPRSLSSIMHSLKRNTAKEANAMLRRSGSFWEHENFDHFIRNQEEWIRIVWYVLQNPVKAGLIADWREWRWNYVRDREIRNAS